MSFISPEVNIVAVRKQKQNSFNNPDGISAYTLLPGEDAYRKIKENLFVKLFVDRKTCLLVSLLLLLQNVFKAAIKNPTL
jgi:hypothetical protein